ncbi:nitrate reductase associated protein [Cyanobium sp. ATX 6F1]|uniref:nitrate reductase associated protein n=1 Tax=unclassified Cyanobium TaxID=2627006 RepID=UPI0020CD57E5|nr:nitrate reductase associated protein [Cyanobium sp. ATX 6F1]MCP9917664.1 nitrate reductase associated protein [Cyanobium sp. ATX 6F1]
MTPQKPSLHNHCFRFESDFVSDLRCLPMAVRRKLDLAGVKLKLSHWHALEGQERALVLAWSDDPAAMAELRGWLMEHTASMPDGPAQPLEPAMATFWQQTAVVPEVLQLACDQIENAITLRDWEALDELQRFALVKLSHPGHEHRNLPRALQEFGLIDPPCNGER